MCNCEKVKTILQNFANKKGHDKCWFNLEVLEELMKLYNIEYGDAELVSKEEFKLGCQRFCEDLYRNSE